ncbi:hypothetical protein DFH09DRAFT_1091473 [Mycena vulgaris]|nr:hypothetical protein DFH09DRAFT_1091473 [Mycena vulgaris]
MSSFAAPASPGDNEAQRGERGGSSAQRIRELGEEGRNATRAPRRALGGNDRVRGQKKLLGISLPIPGRIESVATLRFWKTEKTARGGLGHRGQCRGQRSQGGSLAKRPSARTSNGEENIIFGGEMDGWTDVCRGEKEQRTLFPKPRNSGREAGDVSSYYSCLRLMFEEKTVLGSKLTWIPNLRSQDPENPVRRMAFSARILQFSLGGPEFRITDALKEDSRSVTTSIINST